MLFVDLCSWAIFIYLLYFVVYKFVIITSSYRGKFKDIEKRDYLAKFQQRLTVVIYSHNNSQKVKKLIELLSKQNYDKEKYTVNVVLDNCNEENAKFLEIYGGARLWRINTDVNPIGKYKAFAWFLERIRACENTNAFVFLDADCVIKSDFLEKVNSNLSGDYVLAGETIKRKNFLLNRVANLKTRIKNRVFNHGRYYSNLANIIDTDVLVIKQNILEKIEFDTTENGFEEYEFAVKLKYYNVPVVYTSEVSVNKNTIETLSSLAASEYQKRYKSFKTFLNNYQFVFSKKSLTLSEFVLSFAYPGGFTFIFWLSILCFVAQVYSTTIFANWVGIKYLLVLALLKVVSEIYAMVNIRGYARDYYTLLIACALEPVIYIKSVAEGFKPFKPIARKTEETTSLTYEREIFDATITNGKNEYNCQIETVKSKENAQVSFVFNGKKLTSSRQPRIDFALDEIIDKLRKHGYVLKICSNCGYFYFTESTAAHSGGEQGYCLLKNYKESSKEKEYSAIWGSCSSIIPSQARNYILQQLGIDKNKAKR